MSAESSVSTDPNTTPRTSNDEAPKHRPLIGMPGRRKRLDQVEGFAPALQHLEADLYLTDYAKAVWDAGGLPVNLPLDSEPSAWAEVLDGVVLTGGADIDPARYHQQNTDSSIEPIRDEFEFQLFETARQNQIPVLGICRGLQLINVALGGTLHQDVPEHSRYDVNPAEAVHEVTCQPGSLIAKLYGPEIEVNTLHHQTIDQLAEPLIATAQATDGTIEAVELADDQAPAPILAVQWHPEMMGPDQTVFDWLVKVLR